MKFSICPKTYGKRFYVIILFCIIINVIIIWIMMKQGNAWFKKSVNSPKRKGQTPVQEKPRIPYAPVDRKVINDPNVRARIYAMLDGLDQTFNSNKMSATVADGKESEKELHTGLLQSDKEDEDSDDFEFSNMASGMGSGSVGAASEYFQLFESEGGSSRVIGDKTSKLVPSSVNSKQIRNKTNEKHKTDTKGKGENLDLILIKRRTKGSQSKNGSYQIRKRRQVVYLNANSRNDDVCIGGGESNNDKGGKLQCYQCDADNKGSEPLCDDSLWGYLRHSEKDKLRMRCPVGKESYCVKRVSKKYKYRRTERGCYGPGPIKGPGVGDIPIQNGCVTYRNGDLLTTTCMCGYDLCNGAPAFGPGGAGSLLGITFVILGLFIYALCYSYLSRQDN